MVNGTCHGTHAQRLSTRLASRFRRTADVAQTHANRLGGPVSSLGESFGHTQGY
jgi:hypothetical protein